MVLLVILLFAMVDFLIGSLLPPSDEQMSKGFVGWRGKVTSFHTSKLVNIIFIY